MALGLFRTVGQILDTQAPRFDLPRPKPGLECRDEHRDLKKPIHTVYRRPHSRTQEFRASSCELVHPIGEWDLKEEVYKKLPQAFQDNIFTT